MSDFEEAKSFLMKDENGTNLFDHMSEVLLKVLTERPDDAVALFEQLSHSVKTDRFHPGQDGSASAVDAEAIANYSKMIAKLHKSADEGEEEEEPEEGVDAAEEPLPAPRADDIVDLEAESLAWAAAGIKISPGDILKLHLSLGRLAGGDDSIKTLRLWGKLKARNGDYYVAEGQGGAALEQEEEEEGKVEAEEEANRHTYWVCKFPGDSWTQLGPVRSDQILVARQLKRFLTGSLDAPVNGYPAFPGQEKEYIRALIALINADCAIAPKGYFAVGEDETSVDIAEEYEMPGAEDLADPSTWETYGLPFSGSGHVKPQVGEDEDGNEIPDPEGWEFQWLREAEGDSWTVRRYPQTLQDSKSAKVILRSNKWPGAIAVASPSVSSWTNFYVGYGYPKSDTLYTPPMPPKLQKEFEGALKEQADVIEDPTPPEEAKDEEE